MARVAVRNVNIIHAKDPHLGQALDDVVNLLSAQKQQLDALSKQPTATTPPASGSSTPTTVYSVEESPSPYTAIPFADGGSGSSGVSANFARGDHQHPQQQGDWAEADSTKPDYIKNKPTLTAPVNADWNAVAGLAQIFNKPALGTASSHASTDFDASGAAGAVAATIPAGSSTTPSMDGTAEVGTGTTWARADHVHPADTSRLPAVLTLTVYANNAAALAGGLTAGRLYRSGGDPDVIAVVH